ncbi:hypothetical protein HDU81_004592 [Chytriomyces hyalinus]|nr:hypothetical protein HDU81_004592 [Chytriomyces hyalinus]
MPQPFAPVAAASAQTTPARRMGIVLPALGAVFLSAHSVLVPEWAALGFAFSLAWLVTIVAGQPDSSTDTSSQSHATHASDQTESIASINQSDASRVRQSIYARMLNRWWFSSLAAILVLSLIQDPFAPKLSAKVAVAHAPAVSPHTLLVTVSSLKGLPWGCSQRNIHAFAVFRSHKISSSDGKYGHWSAVEVASIPHEEYIRIPIYDPSSAGSTVSNVRKRAFTTSSYTRASRREETVFMLNNAGDRDLIVKLGVSCRNFPAEMVFGPELFLLDAGSAELHRFTSTAPIPFPKKPMLPARIISFLNPFTWPRRFTSILRTYTTLIELGLVWPFLTRVLEKIFVRYRAERMEAGESVVQLESSRSRGSISFNKVLEGCAELFMALLDVIQGKRGRKAWRNRRNHAVDDDGRKRLKGDNENASLPVLENSSGQSIEGVQALSEERLRANSSPVVGSFSSVGYGKSHSALKTKSNSIWDGSSGRIVGSLLSSVGTLTQQRRKKKWERSGYVFVVIKSYEPIFKDELPIYVGNIIRIKKIFDDGWALGVNESTNVQGILPMAFLTYINPTSPSSPAIDPQSFVPRQHTHSGTSSTNVSGPRTKTSSESPASTPLMHPHELLTATSSVVEMISNEPPAHLRRGRGRSMSRARSNTNIYASAAAAAAAAVSASPVATPTGGSTPGTPVLSSGVMSSTPPVSFPSMERPRGRSSSMHRKKRGGGVGRSKSTKRDHVERDEGGKDNGSIASANSIHGNGGSIQMGRRRSSGASSMLQLKQHAQLAEPMSPEEVTVFQMDDEVDDFDESDADANGRGDATFLGVGVLTGEASTLYDDDIEEVVIDEEGTSESSISEDRDVWPPARGSAAAKRSNRLSISSGYSHMREFRE